MVRHHPKHAFWKDDTKNRDLWKRTFELFEQKVFGPNCPHQFEGHDVRRPPNTLTSQATRQQSQGSGKRRSPETEDTLDHPSKAQKRTQPTREGQETGSRKRDTGRAHTSTLALSLPDEIL